MAIYSRFENELELRRWVSDHEVEAERCADGKVVLYEVAELIADGGIAEIIDALGESALAS